MEHMGQLPTLRRHPPWESLNTIQTTAGSGSCQGASVEAAKPGLDGSKEGPITCVSRVSKPIAIFMFEPCNFLNGHVSGPGFAVLP